MDQKKAIQNMIFLKLFTKEILLKIIERNKSKENIEFEKTKMKILPEEIIEPETVIKTITENLDENKDQKRMTMIHRENIPIKMQTYPIAESIRQNIPKTEKPKISEINRQDGMERSISQREEKIQNRPSIDERKNTKRINIRELLSKPVYKSNVSPMEKLDAFLKDNTIVAIECSGPGKNILVRKYNQINATKIILSEEEIKAVIEHYSKESKIPLTGGILKAAVGNSIISAVVSEFVGSRFIINKITPYSLIGPK